MYCRGGAEESKRSDGDAADTVAHAVKGGDGKKEEDVDAAAALPHVVAPIGAPSAYFRSGERSAYCIGGDGESKGGNGEEEKDGDAATTGLRPTSQRLGSNSFESPCGVAAFGVNSL
jgi:hypothetical protein